MARQRFMAKSTVSQSPPRSESPIARPVDMRRRPPMGSAAMARSRSESPIARPVDMRRRPPMGSAAMARSRSKSPQSGSDSDDDVKEFMRK